MSKIIRFMEVIAPSFIGFGMVGMVDGWEKDFFAIVAWMGIIMLAWRDR